jgi:methionyl-tRNA synthetase
MENPILPPTEEEFEREKVFIWMRYSPRIYACKKCGHAVANGYRCDTCGDFNPNEPRETVLQS